MKILHHDCDGGYTSVQIFVHLSALTKMNAQDRCVSYKNDSSAKLIFFKKDAVFVLMVLTSGGE